MSSSYSPKLRFELVGAGEQAGLWGTTTNKNVGQLIEQAIAGVTTVDLSGLSGNYTLTALDGAPDQSRSAVLQCNGPASGAINLIIPTQTKLYVVRNDSGQSLTVKTTAQTGGVQLDDGEATLVFCDGTDAVLGLETAAAGTLGVDGGGTGQSSFTAGVLASTGGTNALGTYNASSPIPVAYGGTGSATLTSNNVLLGNGTSALQAVAPGTNGNVLTSNGTTWVSSTPAAAGVTSITASTGLSASSSTGAVTLTNTGVTSLTAGTGISLSASTGSVTVSSTVTPSDYVTVAGTQTISGAKTFSSGATFTTNPVTCSGGFISSEQNYTATGTSSFYQADGTGTQILYSTKNSATSSDWGVKFIIGNSGSGNSQTITAALNVRPDTDNTKSLGTGTYRWSVVYAATGSINTSDANLKTEIADLDAAEKRVAQQIKGLIKKFKFKDAVAEKGSNARIHVGVIAQEVAAAFAAEGLDAHKYGLFCEDSWEDTPAMLEKNGRVFSPELKAGSRLGIRYDELLAFVIAAL